MLSTAKSLNPSKCAFLLTLVMLLVVWLTSSQIIADLQQHGSAIMLLTREHLALTIISTGAATLMGVPLGIWLQHHAMDRTSAVMMRCVYIAMIIPVLTLFALAFSLFGRSTLAAIIALWLLSLPPIVYATHAGFASVPSHLKEIAAGIGLQPMQILWRIELPVALFWIFTGIRLALAMNIAAASLAALVGAGGLGHLIFTGIQANNTSLLLTGTICVALLAVTLDFLMGLATRYWVSSGINPLQ